jgi:hypothetical protein
MEQETKFIEAGKQDAKMFISDERIEYEPFVAMSDMHMVRKAFMVDYDSLKKTVEKIDPDLCLEIEDSAANLEREYGPGFSLDGYARGFVEGVAAVWEQIKDKV